MKNEQIHSVQYKGFTITPGSRPGIGYLAVSIDEPALKCFSLTWTGLIDNIHGLLWPEIVLVDEAEVNRLAETFKGINKHIDYDLNNNPRKYSKSI